MFNGAPDFTEAPSNLIYEQDARWAARYFPPQTVLQLHKFEAQG